jgi:hypothetical protein
MATGGSTLPGTIPEHPAVCKLQRTTHGQAPPDLGFEANFSAGSFHAIFHFHLESFARNLQGNAL